MSRDTFEPRLQEEAASYISDMAAELADMARRSHLPAVARLLQLARIEALSTLDRDVASSAFEQRQAEGPGKAAA
jgi:hypothetical protein